MKTNRYNQRPRRGHCHRFQHEADYVFTDSNSVEFDGITVADGIDDPAINPSNSMGLEASRVRWSGTFSTFVPRNVKSTPAQINGGGEMKKKSAGPLQIRNSTAEFLIFTTQAGESGIEVRYEDETIWLTQKLMATLFDVDVRTVSEHLKNIFKSGELQEDSVIRKFRNTAADGKSYLTQFYNLDAIISVGYRVNSVRATQFRQWATRVLREFAIKGYVLDRKRLENGTYLGEDYFERLLVEIREIRLSERRFYQKSPTSMPPAWITTWTLRPRETFLPMFKTSFIMPSMGILRRN